MTELPSSGSQPEVLLIGLQPTAALRSLLRFGVAVTVVIEGDDAEEALASGASRVVVSPSTTDIELVMSALERARVDYSTFSFVGAQGEHETLAAATLKSLSGARGMGLAQALRFRDKYVQKREIRASGLRVADCAVVTSAADVASEAPNFPGRVVVKPLAGAGARDTFMFEDTSALASFVDSRGAAFWLMELFVDGHEHHVDGVYRGPGDLTFAISRDLNNMIKVHDGSLVGSYGLRRKAHPQLYAKVNTFIERVLSALAQDPCVFHCEFFLDEEGELTFGECAARVGGGNISDVLKLQFGLDLYDEWARLLLNLPSGPRQPGSLESYGWINLSLPEGRVVSVPSTDELLGLPGVVRADLTVSVGDASPDVRLGTDVRTGRLLIRADDEDDVVSRLDFASAWFLHQCVVDGPDARGN